MDKKKIITVFAGIAVAGYLGGNYFVASEAQKEVSKEIDKMGVGYAAVKCSSFPDFNPSCTIIDLGKSTGIFASEIRIGNMLDYKKMLENDGGDVNLDLYAKGLQFDGQLKGALAAYSMFVPPQTLQEIKTLTEAFGVDEISVGISGKAMVANKDIVKFDKANINLATRWFDVGWTQSGDYKDGITNMLNKAADEEHLDYIKYLGFKVDVKNRAELMELLAVVDSGNFKMPKEDMKAAGKKLDEQMVAGAMEELVPLEEEILNDSEISSENKKKLLSGVDSLKKFISGEKNSLSFEIDTGDMYLMQALNEISETGEMPKYTKVSLKN